MANEYQLKYTGQEIDEKLGQVNNKIDKINPVGEGSVSINRAEGSIIGENSVTLGKDNTAQDNCSFAEGSNTKAVGESSHAEGFHTQTTYARAHAEGDHTEAFWRAHAEGGYTKALGSHSHSEGAFSQALGGKSHAEGAFFQQVLLKNGQPIVLAQDIEVTEEYPNPALVLNMAVDDVLNEGDLISLMYYDGSKYYGSDTREVAFVEGNVVRVNYTFNEEYNCSIPLPYPSGTMIRQAFPVQAIGGASHAEGTASISKGDHSHAEGYPQTEDVVFPSPMDIEETLTDKLIVQPTTAEGLASHAEGMGTRAVKTASHAEGQRAEALGAASHAEGGFTESLGSYSHSEGYSTKSSGDHSHAEGSSSEATGVASHAEGNNTTANGKYSHAEGNNTTATGNNGSHAEGNGTQATGANGSHAEGHNTQAHGAGSHAEGNGSIVNTGAIAGHAEGSSTIVNARDAHAEGDHTVASSPYQHVQGRYNKIDNIIDKETGLGQYAHIVGNGTGSSEKQRSNAYTLDWNGNAWFAGNISAANIPEIIGDVRMATGSYVGTATVNQGGATIRLSFDFPVHLLIIGTNGLTAIIQPQCGCGVVCKSQSGAITSVTTDGNDVIFSGDIDREYDVLNHSETYNYVAFG